MTENPVPFDELYEHRAWVRALAVSLVRDPGGAADVEQQTWLAAYERAPARGNVRGWLGTVARSKAWKLRRSRDRRERHEELAGAPAPAQELDPAKIVAAAEIHRRVVNLVMELDEPYRTTVLLRFFEDVPTAEIAARTGVPHETVRTRLKRALEMLRARLDGEYGRDCRAWAAPLLGMHPGRAAGPLAPAGAAAATTGVVLMTTKQVVLAVAALVLAAAVVWTATRPAGPGASHSNGADVRLGTSDAAAGPRRAARTGTRTRPGTPDGQPAAAAPSAPAIDRTRDLSGEIVSADGRPVTGAVVRVEFPPLQNLPAGRPGAPGPVTTGADGAFVVHLEQGDVVDVRVDAPGFAQWRVAGLQAGERMRIVLPAAVQLRVLVNGSDEEPAPGVRVTVRSLHAQGKPTTTSEVPLQEGVTDDAGRVVFGSLAGDTNALVVAWPANGHAPLSAFCELPGTDHVELTVPRGEDVTGRVVDAVRGDPVAGAQVTPFVSFGTGEPVTTGADGTFVLRGWRTPGTQLTLRANAPGFVQAQADASKPEPVGILLRRAALLTARAVDASGAPVAGTIVTGSWRPWEPGMFACDADGRLRIEDHDPATPSVFVFSARGAGSATVRLPAAPEATVRDLGDVVLSPAGRVWGRVVDASGAPATRRTVMLLTDDMTSMKPRTTDDLGRFLFDVVPPGAYRIGASFGGPPARWRPLEVAAGDGDEIVLTMDRVREVRVEVVDDLGAPVAGIRVEAQSFVDRAALEERTDAGGVARLPAAGRTAVRVRPEPDRPLLVTPAGQPLRPSQETARFVVRAAGRASGVALGIDGAPLPQAAIDVTSDGVYLARGQTNAEGRFDVVVPVRGGAVVQLAAENAVGSVPAAAGDKELVLQARAVAKMGAFVANVLRPDGTPAAGVRVFATGPGARAEATTDAEGRARFAALPLRELDVVAANHDAFQGSTRQRVLPQGQEVTLRLRGTATVAGRVLDAAGNPVPMANVVVETPSGGRFNAQTDARGAFRVEVPSDEPSPYAVNVQHHWKLGFHDVYVDGVLPGATALEIVLE